MGASTPTLPSPLSTLLDSPPIPESHTTGANTLISAPGVSSDPLSRRLVYDDGWDSSEDDDDSWSRCGSDGETAPDNGEEGHDDQEGLFGGLEEPVLEGDDEEDEEDDFLNLTGHR